MLACTVQGRSPSFHAISPASRMDVQSALLIPLEQVREELMPERTLQSLKDKGEVRGTYPGYLPTSSFDVSPDRRALGSPRTASSSSVGTELTGALCRVGLKSREVSYSHHVTCADLTPQAVASGLRSLLDGLAAAGPKRLGRRARMPVRRGRAVPDWAFPSARGPRWSKRFP